MKLTKTTPYAHQEQAIAMAKDRQSFAYLMEQGTGKSLCLLADATQLYLDEKINCLIIIAPKGCYLNWLHNECPRHILPHLPYRITTWVAPSKQGVAKKAELQGFADTVGMPYLKILLVNVEAIAFDDTYKYLATILRSHKTMVAIDESTAIRTPSSKRCLYARRLGALAKYRRILTGTPIANRPLDLYGQCCFLDPNLLGFPTFQTFKHYYADIGYFQGGRRLNPATDNLRMPGVFPKLVGYKHLKQLSDALNSFSFRVLKKDCLDLPDKVYETRYVEPTPEQKRLYNDMRENMLSSWESGEFTSAQMALIQLLRLHTILCGHLKTDDGDTKLIESNRRSVWADIVEETDGKIITFCRYREDIKLLIGDMPPGSYVEYHGGMSDIQRTDSLNRFANDPLCLHFFATAKTGGTGLTLNMAHTVIYYSQDYDLEKRLQTEDRCHRIGQTNKVTYYDLVVKNTVDEKIIEALHDKQNIADTVLSNLRSFIPAL